MGFGHVPPSMTNNQTTPIRVGAVSYLNSKPLVYRLTEFAPEIDLSFAVPSRLTEQLACQHIDVGLIPSIEYLRGSCYTIVSDACIGCRGPVWSVKLLSRVPMGSIQTLAVDDGSRTSIALVQILLYQRYGLRPELIGLPLDVDPVAVVADAVLVIGDRAIHPPPGPFCHVWDLGHEWCRETGLPFVFALWVARAGFPAADVAPAFAAARDAGIAAAEEIARQEAPKAGISIEACVRYFRHHLHYYLGPKEQAGLATFQQQCEELGLLNPVTNVAPLSVSSNEIVVRAQ